MTSKRRNMFYQNKKQETTEIVHVGLSTGIDLRFSESVFPGWTYQSSMRTPRLSLVERLLFLVDSSGGGNWLKYGDTVHILTANVAIRHYNGERDFSFDEDRVLWGRNNLLYPSRTMPGATGGQRSPIANGGLNCAKAKGNNSALSSPRRLPTVQFCEALMPPSGWSGVACLTADVSEQSLLTFSLTTGRPNGAVVIRSTRAIPGRWHRAYLLWCSRGVMGLKYCPEYERKGLNMGKTARFHRSVGKNVGKMVVVSSYKSAGRLERRQAETGHHATLRLAIESQGNTPLADRAATVSSTGKGGGSKGLGSEDWTLKLVLGFPEWTGGKRFVWILV
ncbi:hypothetical protein AAG570_003884 [Ranatra chinensis]|uniref:Uncharacterized protein n=1 Tax=Ranatra chinensis TaxID=642074 RepID=A0ABD0YNZ8_9HEMI